MSKETEINYPARFKFVVVRNPKTGEQYVMASSVRSKAEIKNIRLAYLQAHFMNGLRSAIIDVKDINSREEMLDVLRSYDEVWKVVGHETVQR